MAKSGKLINFKKKKLKPILCGSDTLSTVTKEISDSIVISGNTASNPYGDDIFTKKCRSTIKKIFLRNGKGWKIN